MTGLVKCELCGEKVALIFAHLVQQHPGAIEAETVGGPTPFECWPDGKAVLYDDSLEPSDFGGGI